MDTTASLECGCGPEPGDIPQPFLAYEPLDAHGGVLLARYESERWRTDELAEHILEWILDYALPRDQLNCLSAGRSREMERRAARMVFGTRRTHNIVGEILLHAACRQVARSIIVLPKVWFKTAVNDEIKGFDGVHAVHGDKGLELWLGEAKFYKSMRGGVAVAAKGLSRALSAPYVRAEAQFIAPRVDEATPHHNELRVLLHENTPIEDVVARVVVPILVSGDSELLGGTPLPSDQLNRALLEEHARLQALIHERVGDIDVQIRFFTVPLDQKRTLVKAVEQRLAPWLRPPEAR